MLVLQGIVAEVVHTVFSLPVLDEFDHGLRGLSVLFTDKATKAWVFEGVVFLRELNSKVFLIRTESELVLATWAKVGLEYGPLLILCGNSRFGGV